MKLKERILIIVLIFIFCIVIFLKDSWILVIGGSVIYIYFIASFIYMALRWNINNKNIKSEYVSVNIENVRAEIFVLFSICSRIKRMYGNRVFDLKYTYNKIVEINNFKEFLTTYDGIEKAKMYMTMGMAIGMLLLIIKKVLCRGRISSEEILLSDGEIIKIKDIKDIQVEDSFWTVSKKITITLENSNRVIYINSKLFTKVEKGLYDIGADIKFV